MVFPRLADAAPPQSSSALGPVSPAFLADVVPAGVHPSELVKRRAVLCRPFRRLAADPASTSPGGHVIQYPRKLRDIPHMSRCVGFHAFADASPPVALLGLVPPTVLSLVLAVCVLPSVPPPSGARSLRHPRAPAPHLGFVRRHTLCNALENYSPLATGLARRKPLAATWVPFVLA